MEYTKWAYSNRDPVWKIWASIRARTYCKSREDYKRWGGGTGIGMCRAWDKFAEFNKWALSHGYAKGLRVIRRNKKRGYSPGNCYFGTDRELNRSRRNVWFLPNGLSMAEAAKLTGLNRTTLRRRLIQGIPLEELTIGPKPQLKHFAIVK